MVDGTGYTPVPLLSFQMLVVDQQRNCLQKSNINKVCIQLRTEFNFNYNKESLRSRTRGRDWTQKFEPGLNRSIRSGKVVRLSPKLPGRTPRARKAAPCKKAAGLPEEARVLQGGIGVHGSAPPGRISSSLSQVAANRDMRRAPARRTLRRPGSLRRRSRESRGAEPFLRRARAWTFKLGCRELESLRRSGWRRASQADSVVCRRSP